MRTGFRIACLFAIVALTISPSFAHHSIVGIYDTKKPVNLKGAIAGIEWINPHVLLHIEVTDAASSVTPWLCEMGSPNMLTRGGLKKDSFKVGDSITIEGASAKDGSHGLRATMLKLADGQRVFDAPALGAPGVNQ